MVVNKSLWLSIVVALGGVMSAHAQSFRVQCPLTTALHPGTTSDQGAIKCQQISGGDGYSTMADGHQIFMFSFGPLSGLNDIANGLPGTQPAPVFMTTFDPGALPGSAASNGAVGLSPDPDVADDPACGATAPSPKPSYCTTGLTGHVDPRQILDVGVMNGNIPAPLMAIDEDDEFFLTLTNVGMVMRPDLFEQHTVHFHGYPNASSFYDGVPDASVAIDIGGSMTYYYLAPDAGTYFWHCHITPPEHLQMGMVGQIYVRPRQNRVSSGSGLWASLAGGSGLAGSNPTGQQSDLRTKCGSDILCSSPIPPSNSVTHAANKNGSPTLYAYNDGDGSTAYDVEYPIQIHGFDPSFHFVGQTFNPEQFTDMKDKYFLLNGRSYPDTIRTTQYVDPGSGSGNSAFVGQPAISNAMYTQDSDAVARPSQPLNTVVNIPAGGKALLRISDLDVTEYQTLASLGIPMHVIGLNARMLRDLAGNNMSYFSNSITLAGGESIDVVLDASLNKPDGTAYTAGETYYLYTPNLDHLANDAENFGGLMTEIHICNSVDPSTKICK